MGEAVFDADGTSWAVSVGRGAAKQREVYGGAKGCRDDKRLPIRQQRRAADAAERLGDLCDITSRKQGYSGLRAAATGPMTF